MLSLFEEEVHASHSSSGTGTSVFVEQGIFGLEQPEEFLMNWYDEVHTMFGVTPVENSTEAGASQLQPSYSYPVCLTLIDQSSMMPFCTPS